MTSNYWDKILATYGAEFGDLFPAVIISKRVLILLEEKREHN